jgi:hypothetical protein
MTSFAIYEIIGFIIALPLSYLLAYLSKKYTYSTYKDELEKLFQVFWNGEKEDELNAWLKVRNLIPQSDVKDKRVIFINRKIKKLNRSNIYSETSINEKGEVRIQVQKTIEIDQ